MAIGPFLAFSWAEMENCDPYPEKAAWLGCHFSSSGSGLSNLPPTLPPGSLLIIDDWNPIQGHDPGLICQQAKKAVEQWQCCGVLLDFQRKDQEEAPEMAKALAEALPCPVAVSALYARELTCPVFLPPVPCSMPLEKALWPGRECWLELALDGECITISESGAQVSPLEEFPETGFEEKTLHCHYTLELTENQAQWFLWRTKEDIQALLEEAEHLGITQTVGLWQEVNDISF